jgi:hypothetical protein
MSAVNLSAPNAHGEHEDMDHAHVTWSLTSGVPWHTDTCCVCDEPIVDVRYYGAHNCQDYAHVHCVTIGGTA